LYAFPIHFSKASLKKQKRESPHNYSNRYYSHVATRGRWEEAAHVIRVGGNGTWRAPWFHFFHACTVLLTQLHDLVSSSTKAFIFVQIVFPLFSWNNTWYFNALIGRRECVVNTALKLCLANFSICLPLFSSNMT
jgi:hypothetical protein